MESLRTVRDYEGEFWLHDIFVSASRAAPGADVYFKDKGRRTRGRGFSFGGFDKNRLFLNQRGERFLELAHLFGVALQDDCRNVVVEDLDGDGRTDLIVTSVTVRPEIQFTLHVFRNELPNTGNWIGFRFAGASAQPGARVTLDFGGRKAVRQLCIGSGYRTQDSSTVHFGLGTEQVVKSAMIRWPGGATLLMKEPEINRIHVVQTPH
jgi:hypothetical protein